MGDNIEISIGKLTAQMDMVVKGMEDARQSRKEQYQGIQNLNEAVSSLVNRVGTVERQLMEVSPTIAEFIAIKHKVNGAGLLGKMLWAFGGVLLASIAWINGAREWLLK